MIVTIAIIIHTATCVIPVFVLSLRVNVPVNDDVVHAAVSLT